MLPEETICPFPAACLGSVLVLVRTWSELDQVFGLPEEKLLGG